LADKQLVLPSARINRGRHAAAQALKDSEITDGASVGLLVLDSDGELKQDEVAARIT
jgi:hypothetical protein